VRVSAVATTAKKDAASTSSTNSKLAASLTPEVAKDLYYDMVLGREFEEMCAQMYYRGKMFGFVHLYSGQEAVSTGVWGQMMRFGGGVGPWGGAPEGSGGSHRALVCTAALPLGGGGSSTQVVCVRLLGQGAVSSGAQGQRHAPGGILKLVFCGGVYVCGAGAANSRHGDRHNTPGQLWMPRSCRSLPTGSDVLPCEPCRCDQGAAS
jgi:TPP-dependent pyruvate/acetoin dehydrogenase alpha subunit